MSFILIILPVNLRPLVSCTFYLHIFIILHKLVWDILVKSQFAFFSVPLSAPRNLRVSDEWYNRLRISWDAPPSATMGYRVVYKPVNSEFSNWFFCDHFWLNVIFCSILFLNLSVAVTALKVLLPLSHFWIWKFHSHRPGAGWSGSLEVIWSTSLNKTGPAWNRFQWTLASWIYSISNHGDFKTTLSISPSFWLLYWKCLC